MIYFFLRAFQIYNISDSTINTFNYYTRLRLKNTINNNKFQILIRAHAEHEIFTRDFIYRQ